ncbi:glycine-rich domain-containing protein [Amycolatopsis pigmentata]|uniref:Glycine-rich domain-containing protein n=1 Tax=Amycolatopsis pigmentata TaxID=450801 RepID=A0ABW5FWI3_9PSEU
MTAVVTDRVTGRSLIPQDLFERLVSRIVTDDGKTYDLAARIMDQALAFLGTCARYHRAHLTPSELVDVGWHTFILYTREYKDFCQRIGGRFLHHVRADGEPAASGETARAKLAQTVEAIMDAGFAVDQDLWPVNANCSQCKNGCYDDPPPPPGRN